MTRELLEAGADLHAENAAGESPLALAKKRPRRALDLALRKERLKSTVPDATGFFVPWLQIGAGALLTTVWGWAIGCAAFGVACGLLGTAAGLTRGAEKHVQHGFAAGSIFFIVGSGYVYLYDQVLAVTSLQRHAFFGYPLSCSVLLFSTHVVCFVVV
jgi:hypothetical protein